MLSRWWQLKYFLFSPLFPEMIQFDQYFSDGLKPRTSKSFQLIEIQLLMYHRPWTRRLISNHHRENGGVSCLTPQEPFKRRDARCIWGWLFKGPPNLKGCPSMFPLKPRMVRLLWDTESASCFWHPKFGSKLRGLRTESYMGKSTLKIDRYCPLVM